MNKVSVVIPTYNRKESLRVTLEALARQTMPAERFEVIVVSDGSTDGTAEMLDSLVTTLPYRLVPISQANGGPSAARNQGIKAASNEIIVLTDDDIEPLPEFLDAHVRRHEDDRRIVILGPMSPDPARAAVEPVWIAWEHTKLGEIYDLFRPGGSNSDGRGGPVHFYSGNASVRREHLLAVGGFDEKYRRQEDVELAFRLSRECGAWFLFDFATDAIHRPMRSFASWLAIPRAYGKLDAQRVHAGTLPAGSIEATALSRNPATRALSSLCIAVPFIEPAVVVILRIAASAAWSIGARGAAIASLSALYNAVYRGEFVREMRRPNRAVSSSPSQVSEARKPNA